MSLIFTSPNSSLAQTSSKTRLRVLFQAVHKQSPRWVVESDQLLVRTEVRLQYLMKKGSKGCKKVEGEETDNRTSNILLQRIMQQAVVEAAICKILAKETAGVGSREATNNTSSNLFNLKVTLLELLHPQVRCLSRQAGRISNSNCLEIAAVTMGIITESNLQHSQTIHLHPFIISSHLMVEELFTQLGDSR